MLQSPPPGISCWVRVANVELHLGNTLLCASSQTKSFSFRYFYIFSISPFQPDGESLDELEARIIGSKGCPFAGGMFKLKITVLIPLPTNFPANTDTTTKSRWFASLGTAITLYPNHRACH